MRVVRAAGRVGSARDAEGDVGAMPLYAGQSVVLVKKRQPAGEIVREINDQAQEIIRRLAR